MQTAFGSIGRRPRKIETSISAILLAAIIILLALPSPGGFHNFGSAVRNVFTLVEGDYLNPLLSTARTVTILNCAADGIAQFAGYDDFSSRVTIDNETKIVNVTRYNGALLSILDIELARSAPATDREPAAYISESFWTETLGRREDVIGMSFTLYGAPYRIIGVTRDHSGLLAKTDVWLPISGRGVYANMSSMRVLGMLNPGADWRLARRELIRCFDDLITDQPYTAIPGARLLPLETNIFFQDNAPVVIAARVKTRSSSRTSS